MSDRTAPNKDFAIEAVARLVSPRSVAILGVSGKPDAASRPGGRLLLKYLMNYGFSGPVYPVNRRLDEVDGLVVYPDVGSIPGPVDCAVIALPAAAVPAAVEECGVSGIHQLLLLGAGFGELGREGKVLERRTLEAAATYGVRLVGPNSAGIVNVAGSIALSMTSVLGGRDTASPGRIALLLQSGAMGSTILDRMAAHGAGVSHMVSLGNQIDLDVSDFLAHCATDDATGAVCVYVESLPDGPRVREAIELVERSGKRVFILLAGRSRLGEQAAVTHTGRIVGRHGLEAAVVDAAGATRVDDIDALWQSAHLATTSPRSFGGSRIGIFTISGGLSVLTSDAIGTLGGFEMPAPSPRTVERLRGFVPDYAELTNPLDLGSGTMPDGFLPSLLAFGADDVYDSIAVVLPVVAPWWQDSVSAAIVQAAREVGKPVVVCWSAGATNAEAVAGLREHGIAVVETPSALARLLAGHRGPKASVADRVPMPGAVTDRVTRSDPELLVALAHAGCDIPGMAVAASAEDIPDAAGAVGWPLALKAIVTSVAHKSDLGLVRTGISDQPALARAVAGISAALVQRDLAASGWLVQAMAGEGVELVLSIRRDPDLGDFAGIGLGGTLVELLGDVVFVPLPSTPQQLRRRLEGLPAGDVLFGYRGVPPIDIDWVHRTVEAMAVVARDLDASELEANPVIVGGEGGFVVDALLVAAGR